MYTNNNKKGVGGPGIAFEDAAGGHGGVPVRAAGDGRVRLFGGAQGGWVNT